jgi:hypothetical protein
MTAVVEVGVVVAFVVARAVKYVALDVPTPTLSDDAMI